MVSSLSYGVAYRAPVESDNLVCSFYEKGQILVCGKSKETIKSEWSRCQACPHSGIALEYMMFLSVVYLYKNLGPYFGQSYGCFCFATLGLGTTSPSPEIASLCSRARLQAHDHSPASASRLLEF